MLVTVITKVITVGWVSTVYRMDIGNLGNEGVHLKKQIVTFLFNVEMATNVTTETVGIVVTLITKVKW
jgi:hypothetical protein